jgi:hypothetical protein
MKEYKMNTKHYFLVSALILVMLASTSIIALSARSHDRVMAVDIPAQEQNFESQSLSGDDIYDLAAPRGLDESTLLDNGNYSGDDYDPAVQVHSSLIFRSYGNYSGDDIYDLAAPFSLDISTLQDNGNYSGDDYDPAVQVHSSLIFRSCGNYSGDDIYDLAAPRSLDVSTLQDNGNYSGDDVNDVAAGR